MCILTLSAGCVTAGIVLSLSLSQESKRMIRISFVEIQGGMRKVPSPGAGTGVGPKNKQSRDRGRKAQLSP